MAGKFFIFRFDDVEVHEREFTLVKAGETLAVEPKAFRVLLTLLRNPGKLIGKEELLNAVWGDAAVTDNSLARSIALLRRLLGDETRNPRYIETVATVGYRFIGKVGVSEDASGELDGVAKPVVPVSGEPAAVPANWQAAVATTAPPQTNTSGDHTEPGGKHKRLPGWLMSGAVVLAAGLASAIWYLHRPLPPPKITGYAQITYDGRRKVLGATDGSRLYFNQSSPHLIAQIAVNGGETAPLPFAIPGAVDWLMDLSPDGSGALVGSLEEGRTGMGQWVVPVLGGAPRRLEDTPAVNQFGWPIDGTSFSPDGASVIYSDAAGQIVLSRIDGSGKRKLAHVGSFAAGFRWSPDGKVIRFHTPDGLWEMAQDGTGAHRLLSGWKRGACCGRWTPDGSFYLFLGPGSQIFALDERRGFLRQPPSDPIELTNGPLHWGPLIPGRDGKTIFADGQTLRGELVRIDTKSDNAQPYLGGISAETISFSPDGNSVAYVAFPGGPLWKASRDGSNRIQLTQPPGYAFNPRWSPDSREIVYFLFGPDGHSSIHRISADGTPLWLTPEATEDLADPEWSPDGKKIVFANGPVAYYTSSKRDLRIVDLETRQVTVVPGSDGMRSPRWSPDGRYVLAIQGASEGLALFDFATRQWRKLPVSGDTEYPWFSHDSRSVYFMRVGRNQGVFRIPVEGGKEDRVADMSDWHLTGYFGFSMTLDPDDAPLVLRDAGSDDIYALTLEEK